MVSLVSAHIPHASTTYLEDIANITTHANMSYYSDTFKGQNEALEKKIFRKIHAFVSVISGSQANLICYSHASMSQLAEARLPHISK